MPDPSSRLSPLIMGVGVYTLKIGLDGKIDHYKFRMATKRCTQIMYKITLKLSLLLPR